MNISNLALLNPYLRNTSWTACYYHYRISVFWHYVHLVHTKKWGSIFYFTLSSDPWVFFYSAHVSLCFLLKLIPRMAQFLRDYFFQPWGISFTKFLKTSPKVISSSSFVHLWQISILSTYRSISHCQMPTLKLHYTDKEVCNNLLYIWCYTLKVNPSLF